MPVIPGDVAGEEAPALVGAIFSPMPPGATDVNDDGRTSAADLPGLLELLQAKGALRIRVRHGSSAQKTQNTQTRTGRTGPAAQVRLERSDP